MVIGGADAVPGQEGGGLLAAGAVAQVHDAAARDAAADVEQLPLFVLRPPDDIGQVFPGETGLQQVFLPEGELLHDVVRDFRGRRRGQGDHGRGNALADLSDRKVVRAEVIAPLGDAVGLVHDDEADGEDVEVGLEERGPQALRGDIEELEVAVGGVVQGVVGLPAGHPGVDREGLDAAGGEVLDLVLHQRDERGHDERDAVPQERGDLEAHGLAAARRQQRERVPPVQRGGDDLLLHRTEGLVAPILPQHLQRSHFLFVLLRKNTD